MPASAVAVLLDMITFLIENTIMTLTKITAFFGDLLVSLGFAARVGGPAAFSVSLIVLVVAGYVIARVFFGGAKKLIIFIPLGIILAYILLLGFFV